MRLEAALFYLRLGYGIYRKLDPPEKFLMGSIEHPLCSVYLTLFDILAEDWEISKEEDERV